MTSTRLNPVTHMETAATLSDLGIRMNPASGFEINTSNVVKYGDVFMCNMTIKNSSAISAFSPLYVCYVSGVSLAAITGPNYMGQTNPNGNCWVSYIKNNSANTTLDGRMIGFL